MKILKKIFINIAIMIVVGYVGISWVLSSKVLMPESANIEKTKGTIEKWYNTTFDAYMKSLPTPSEFSITTFDDLTLRGKYFSVSDSSYCAIIMAHGWNTTWADMLKYVPLIDDCGCDIIMYDHRAHGASDGQYATGGINEAKDLLAVTEWVQNKHNFSATQIGWIGSSWGAATALTAGADAKNVGFIIADSPFQDWYSAVFERAIRDYGSITNLLSFGVFNFVNMRADIDYRNASALISAPKIKEPVLLIHSKTDPATNSLQSVNISNGLNEKSTFHHTQWGNLHTMDAANNPTEFKILIQEFLSKNWPNCGKKKSNPS